jgi:hypothetical protein
LCGEISTIKLVEELMMTTGDQLEIKEYQRLTNLDRSLGKTFYLSKNKKKKNFLSLF